MSHLNKVSISGADDGVDPSKLVELTVRYPWVEWALLYYPGKEGKPRNPSREWRSDFLDMMSFKLSKIAKLKPYNHTAIHLCGRLAFYQLLAGSLPSSMGRYGRMQLNVNAREPEFTGHQVLEIYEKAGKLTPTVILQSHEYTKTLIESFLSRYKAGKATKFEVLSDMSRGKGIVPENWYNAFQHYQVPVGFAGGLGPENLVENLTQLENLGVNYWIDMETNVRTDNKFDLDKVEHVLQLSAPFFNITLHDMSFQPTA